VRCIQSGKICYKGEQDEKIREILNFDGQNFIVFSLSIVDAFVSTK
jgi:hypothetical protein